MLDLLPGNVAAVEAQCRTLGWIGPDESIEGLTPAGAGNMNRTVRVQLTSRTFILKQSVPFVAKYPQIAAPADRIGTENRFYSSIAADGPLSMRMPARIGFDPGNRLLALEDVGAGGDFLHLYKDGLSELNGRGHFTALVYWLWRLHALQGIDADDFANREMRVLNHQHIFVIPLLPGNGAAITPGLESIAAQFAADEGLRNIATQLGEIYLGNASHASRTCLLHGDYYPGSWLHHDRLGVAIIDPEFAFVGPPEFDVGVMLAHLTFAGFSQQDLMGTLRAYVTPPGFDYGLAIRFAAIEIIRRLLGVAQLPLEASVEQRTTWLNTARTMIGA
jgi:5-methylthioribose kinase